MPNLILDGVTGRTSKERTWIESYAAAAAETLYVRIKQQDKGAAHTRATLEEIASRLSQKAAAIHLPRNEDADGDVGPDSTNR